MEQEKLSTPMDEQFARDRELMNAEANSERLRLAVVRKRDEDPDAYQKWYYESDLKAQNALAGQWAEEYEAQDS